jgi:hypothetical protein
MGESRGAYGVLVRKPEERRPLGRPRRKWEDNIKMGLREVTWGGEVDTDWIDLAQDRGRWCHDWELLSLMTGSFPIFFYFFLLYARVFMSTLRCTNKSHYLTSRIHTKLFTKIHKCSFVYNRLFPSYVLFLCTCLIFIDFLLLFSYSLFEFPELVLFFPFYFDDSIVDFFFFTKSYNINKISAVGFLK